VPSWNDGYVVDVPYTWGYYQEMNPARVDFSLLLGGREPLPEGPCCELGFGQGVTVNVLAAGNPARRWWGNDFNASQARQAIRTAQAAGAGATLTDESFAQFCAREDLPQFAFVALHGVFSWVSADDRARIVDFLRRRLMVGGVVYVSYNVAAGWAAMAPVRQLFSVHAQRAASAGSGSVERMREAMAFVERVLATDPPYLRLNPSVRKRMEGLAGQQAEYLPHEYLNAGWTLFDFASVHGLLSAAKLDYAGPALLTERVDDLHLEPAQKALLGEIRDPVLRESTRELMLSQQFRRDYWVKGEARVPARGQRERLQSQRFLLSVPPSRVPANVQGQRGEMGLEPSVYGPVVAALDAADGALSFADIARRVGAQRALTHTQLTQAIAILVGTGVVHPVPDDARAEAARAPCAGLNAYLLEQSTRDARIGVLASPVTGGGVTISHASQLFVLARRQGMATPERMAAFAWDALKGQGLGLTREGKPLASDAENLAELEEQARQYQTAYERIYRRADID